MHPGCILYHVNGVLKKIHLGAKILLGANSPLLSRWSKFKLNPGVFLHPSVVSAYVRKHLAAANTSETLKFRSFLNVSKKEIIANYNTTGHHVVLFIYKRINDRVTHTTIRTQLSLDFRDFSYSVSFTDG